MYGTYVFLLMAHLGSPWGAAQLSTMKPGTVEFSVGGGLNWQSQTAAGDYSGTLTQFSLQGELGYFVTDILEFVGGLNVGYSGQNNRVGRSTTVISNGGLFAIRANLPTQSTLVPFATAGIAATGYSGDVQHGANTTTFPLLQLGTRVIVGDAASVNFIGQYSYVVNPLGAPETAANVLSFLIGLSAFK